MLSIFHKRRKPREIDTGITGGHLVWERRELPGAGAGQYSFETYGTPVYDFALGNGATFIRRPFRETSPFGWAKFTAPVLPNPPSNIFQGQWATQPLVDPNTAVALNLTVDGAISPDAYNTVQPASVYPGIAGLAP